MRVCLICAEFFGWGSRGGFGYATRVIGRELVKQGVETYAVIPRPQSQSEQRLELEGVKIVSVERTKPFSAADIYREIDADVYHSQQPSLASLIAQTAQPDKIHLGTLRDPRSIGDWWKEFTHPTHHKIQVAMTWGYYENPLARRALQRMHGLYVPAYFLADKAQKLYSLKEKPGFLPTPVLVPEAVEKTQRPTLLFVGRWDRVKQPWRFFELAKQFPQVDFVAIGSAHNLDYEAELRAKYSGISNLNMVGYVDQFASNALSDYLGQAWVLVNTSAKEALPNTFVEACAHRCAIISPLDPDNFASRFGVHVKENRFADAVSYLLANDRWRAYGQAGYEYVRERNELATAATSHIQTYRQHLEG